MSDYIPRAAVEALIRWLLGYEDFPEWQPGDGAFYWRKELRVRADALLASAQERVDVAKLRALEELQSRHASDEEKYTPAPAEARTARWVCAECGMEFTSTAGMQDMGLGEGLHHNVKVGTSDEYWCGPVERRSP